MTFSADFFEVKVANWRFAPIDVFPMSLRAFFAKNADLASLCGIFAKKPRFARFVAMTNSTRRVPTRSIERNAGYRPPDGAAVFLSRHRAQIGAH
jgi:hypothetical protein